MAGGQRGSFLETIEARLGVPPDEGLSWLLRRYRTRLVPAVTLAVFTLLALGPLGAPFFPTSFVVLLTIVLGLVAAVAPRTSVLLVGLLCLPALTYQDASLPAFGLLALGATALCLMSWGAGLACLGCALLAIGGHPLVALAPTLLAVRLVKPLRSFVLTTCAFILLLVAAGMGAASIWQAQMAGAGVQRFPSSRAPSTRTSSPRARSRRSAARTPRAGRACAPPSRRSSPS